MRCKEMQEHHAWYAVSCECCALAMMISGLITLVIVSHGEVHAEVHAEMHAEVHAEMHALTAAHLDPVLLSISRGDAEVHAEMHAMTAVHLDPVMLSFIRSDAEVHVEMHVLNAVHLDPVLLSFTGLITTTATISIFECSLPRCGFGAMISQIWP